MTTQCFSDPIECSLLGRFEYNGQSETNLGSVRNQDDIFGCCLEVALALSGNHGCLFGYLGVLLSKMNSSSTIRLFLQLFFCFKSWTRFARFAAFYLLNLSD